MQQLNMCCISSVMHIQADHDSDMYVSACTLADTVRQRQSKVKASSVLTGQNQCPKPSRSRIAVIKLMAVELTVILVFRP